MRGSKDRRCWRGAARRSRSRESPTGATLEAARGRSSGETPDLQNVSHSTTGPADWIHTRQSHRRAARAVPPDPLRRPGPVRVSRDGDDRLRPGIAGRDDDRGAKVRNLGVAPIAGQGNVNVVEAALA